MYTSNKMSQFGLPFTLLLACFSANSIAGIIPSNIATDFTLTAADSPWEMTSHVTVQAGATLTVEANASVNPNGKQFKIYGTLNASSSSIPTQITYYEGSAGNLQNSTLTIVRLEGDGNRVINGNTLGYAIFASQTGSSVPTVTGNTFTDALPLHMDINLDPNDISGNTYIPDSRIYLERSSAAYDKTLDSIDGLNVYEVNYVHDEFYISAGVTLTVAPGIEIREADFSGYRIYVYGELRAEDVNFSKGKILVNPGATIDLKNCELTSSGYILLEDGADCMLQGNTIASYVRLEGDGNRVINGNTLGYAIFASQTGSSVPTVTGNTFTDALPLHMDINLDPNDISGNTYIPDSRIYLERSSAAYDKTLDSIDGLNVYEVNYVHDEFYISAGVTLTVAPGIEIREADFSGYRIYVYGELRAEDVNFSKGKLFVDPGATIDLTRCTVDSFIELQAGSTSYINDSVITQYIEMNGLGTRKTFCSDIGQVYLRDGANAGCMSNNVFTQSNPFVPDFPNKSLQKNKILVV